jgi:hypothetical protein
MNGPVPIEAYSSKMAPICWFTSTVYWFCLSAADLKHRRKSVVFSAADLINTWPLIIRRGSRGRKRRPLFATPLFEKNVWNWPYILLRSAWRPPPFSQILDQPLWHRVIETPNHFLHGELSGTLPWHPIPSFVDRLVVHSPLTPNHFLHGELDGAFAPDTQSLPSWKAWWCIRPLYPITSFMESLVVHSAMTPNHFLHGELGGTFGPATQSLPSWRAWRCIRPWHPITSFMESLVVHSALTPNHFLHGELGGTFGPDTQSLPSWRAWRCIRPWHPIT